MQKNEGSKESTARMKIIMNVVKWNSEEVICRFERTKEYILRYMKEGIVDES